MIRVLALLLMFFPLSGCITASCARAAQVRAAAVVALHTLDRICPLN